MPVDHCGQTADLCRFCESFNCNHPEKRNLVEKFIQLIRRINPPVHVHGRVVRLRSGTRKRQANDGRRHHRADVTWHSNGSGSPNTFARHPRSDDDRRRSSYVDRRRGGRRQCVSVLTGHPRVDGRLEYVARLLRQLRRQIVTDDEADDSNDAGLIDDGDECQNPTDVYVYCDGDCGDTLRLEFIDDRWVEFRELPKTDVATNQNSAPATSKIRAAGLQGSQVSYCEADALQ
jgi:hypothetical protein